jgi:CheY-like chemotaxis protein
MRILVIENDQGVSDTFREFFEFCGHTCETANDRVTTILQVFTKKFDVIFADLPLPDLDHGRFASIVEANDPERKIRIVVVSNYDVHNKETILKEIGVGKIFKNFPSLDLLEKSILKLENTASN